MGGDIRVCSEDGKYRYLYSPDKKYRYWLEAKELCEKPKKDGAVLFIMMNPATKYCEARSSPTTRDRCEDFAAKWGYDTLWTCNLFAFPDKNPAVLKDSSFIGPNNDHYIRKYARRADKIVCAWGDGKGKGSKIDERRFRIARGNQVWHMLRSDELLSNMYHLGCSFTRKDQPRHPKSRNPHLPLDSKLVPYTRGLR